MRFFIGCLFLITSTSHADELGNSPINKNFNLQASTHQKNSCTSEEIRKNQETLSFCKAKWEKWGVSPPPPKSELRNPFQCTSLVSKGTLEACSSALIALPSFLGEVYIKALLKAAPVDKNSLIYVSRYGSLRDIETHLFHNFMEKTCGISNQYRNQLLSQS